MFHNYCYYNEYYIFPKYLIQYLFQGIGCEKNKKVGFHTSNQGGYSLDILKNIYIMN
jgi:hypothetical protein